MLEQNNNLTEDIFAETDSTPPANQSGSYLSDSLQELPTEEYYQSDESGSRKFLWLGVAGGIVLVLLAGYFIYSRYGSSNSLTENIIVEPNKTDENINSKTPTTTPEFVGTSTTTEPIQLTPGELDNDRDGLSNDQEKALNTNPSDPDTDHDGLFDYEEVRVYQTDPLNPDTDGDGFVDGSEVEKGYNPKGAGKLLDLNFELKKLNK